MHNDFEKLKEICRVACHERNACKEGFEALLAADTTAQLMQVWRKNWQDIYESKFSDVMAARIAEVARSTKMRREMKQADVYVNESSDRGLIIISRPRGTVFVSGNAKAYVFAGPAAVEATDHAQVFCKATGTTLTLRGHAFGVAKAGNVTLYDRAFLKGHPESISINDAATYEPVKEEI